MIAGHSLETLQIKMSSSGSAEVHQLCGIDGDVPKMVPSQATDMGYTATKLAEVLEEFWYWKSQLQIGRNLKFEAFYQEELGMTHSHKRL